ncbi:MazG family protein [Aeromicrobium terrae]|uniref:MazG family protein n=1 Tax=Aeromicrobium terrae TaxID=2498846 RepID=A0A5C8NGT8_9ACTN|nr:MazG family protein [Aeromicrobium terrae]TXL57356.1 MazG family protein [Aeromicrobium terrae]
MMRILLVSPRVAPGLLTLEAWDVLRAASRVFSAEDGPHIEAIEKAGITVTVSTERPKGEDVLWIAPPGDVAWAHEVAAELLDGDGPEVEVLLGSYDMPGARLLDLVAVMDRLRRECPWTQQQTHTSLAPYLAEESQEALEAIESGDLDHLREELGDVLMQVVFHAAVSGEQPEGWDVDDVAAGITEKLIRRNPHVFGDAVATTVEEIDAQWNRIKEQERHQH